MTRLSLDELNHNKNHIQHAINMEETHHLLRNQAWFVHPYQAVDSILNKCKDEADFDPFYWEYILEGMKEANECPWECDTEYTDKMTMMLEAKMMVYDVEIEIRKNKKKCSMMPLTPQGWANVFKYLESL